MADITHLPVQRTGLTSGHRFLIYAIQDLCIDISQRSDELTATYSYHGNTHELQVSVYQRGSTQGVHLLWAAQLYLPPQPLAPEDSLQALGDIITALEGYLPTPGGAA